MHMLMAAAVLAAASLAAVSPASATSAGFYKPHVWLNRTHYSRWPAGWQNVPLENRGGACPKGDCGLLGTRLT